MGLFFFFVRDQVVLEEREEALEDEFVFLLDDLSDGLGRERVFVLFYHGDQSLDLLLVLFPDLLVAFELKLQAFSMIDPVDPFGPSYAIVKLLKDLVELSFGLRDVFLLSVYHQVIILCEQGNQRVLLELNAPGQLLEESEEFVGIDSVSFGETADVNDGMQRDIIFFELSQDFLSYVYSAAALVKARNVQHPEAYLFIGDLECSTFIEIDFGGDFLQAVSNLDCGVASQQLGSGTLPGPRTTDYQNIEHFD